MVRGEVEPLIPDPERYVIHPLPTAPMQLPWKVAAHDVMVSNAQRFDGRTDLMGRKCLRYLSDCSLSLGVVNVASEYVLIVTKMRWVSIAPLIRAEVSGDQGAPMRAAINNLRRLHTQIIAAVESAAAV